jgi:hypothetical protein
MLPVSCSCVLLQRRGGYWPSYRKRALSQALVPLRTLQQVGQILGGTCFM